MYVTHRLPFLLERACSAPEIPDIEVYLSALRTGTVGEKLRKIRLASPFLLRSVEPPIAALNGLKVRPVDRLGKRPVFAPENDLFLTLHLMVGDGFPTKVTAFRPEMAVHGRYRKPCPDCGRAIQRIICATNEANSCPHCQTGGRILADRVLSRLLKNDWPRSLEELEGRFDLRDRI